MNILLYDGIGVANLQRPLKKVLKQLLSHMYDIVEVDGKVLREQPWQETTALLIMPGGRDLPFLEALGDSGAQKVRDWVRGGGKYFGICAGAYFGSSRIEFEMDRPDYKVQVHSTT